MKRAIPRCLTSSLKRFPIDVIKVDRSFVRALQAHEADRAITDVFIALGRTLNLTVIAEGVQAGRQMEFLKDPDCDESQSFAFSKAVPAETIGGSCAPTPG